MPPQNTQNYQNQPPTGAPQQPIVAGVGGAPQLTAASPVPPATPAASTPRMPAAQPFTPAPAAQPQNLPPPPTAPAVPQKDMRNKADAPKGNPNSTQNALQISEIRDSMVIVNDGSMRAIVTCQSINFDLMSDREREAVEYSYQQFLNSLYFPIQILIRSQKVDIGPYLDRLDKIRRDQDNMLLGVLMDDYINFIGMLAQETNIMDKSFFIVVPYYPAGDMTSAVNSSKNFLTNLFAPQRQQHIRIDEAAFAKAKDEIKNRVGTVVNGLLQMGVRATQLTTKDLGELYYNVYNPDTAVREPIGNFENLGAPIVTKGKGNAPQPQLDKELQ